MDIIQDLSHYEVFTYAHNTYLISVQPHFKTYFFTYGCEIPKAANFIVRLRIIKLRAERTIPVTISLN